MKTIHSKHSTLSALLGMALILFLGSSGCQSNQDQLRLGFFEINVTPPIGNPVAYGPAVSIEDSLYAKGVVLLSDEPPVVLCAVDWITISNEGYEVWRKCLADAAGTTVDRVSVHDVHQHDAVRCDFATERLLAGYGLGGWRHDTIFEQKCIDAAGVALQKAMHATRLVTHVGFGRARVEKVASNRRILGEDGKVRIVRYSSSRNPAAIESPEGIIDPWLKCFSFWNGDEPLAVLDFYAVHPISHYRKGQVSSEFVGIARDKLQKELGIPHIYFTGAGGNVAAGKYNDGSTVQRGILEGRMEKAMRLAWEQTVRQPVLASDLHWRNTEVQLPVSDSLVEEKLWSVLASDDSDSVARFNAARGIVWLQREKEGFKTNISAMELGDVFLLNLPGETFVEYQLAAQQLKPKARVCVAAYEDHGPLYVGTEIAYSQGGYEVEPRVSMVSPNVESVLMEAISKVLDVEP